MKIGRHSSYGSCKDEVNRTLAQHLGRYFGLPVFRIKDDARVLPGKAFNNLWQYRGGDGLGTGYSEFSSCRIRQKFDASYSLPELIENGRAAW